MWTSFSDFLHMGGHGFYVWVAYGVSLGLIGLEIIQQVRKAKKQNSQLLSLAKINAATDKSTQA